LPPQLTRGNFNVIAELKKASPFLGIIREIYAPAELAALIEARLRWGVIRRIANLPIRRRFVRPPSTEAPSLHQSYPEAVKKLSEFQSCKIKTLP
jgi:hypothetical protein